MKSITKTPVQEFSRQLVDRIQSAVLSFMKEAPPPYIAAFDADGTLWNMDMGESFFDYQIHNCGLKNLPPDPWGHYLGLKQQGRMEEAYLWLAQINQGQSLSQVRDWATSFFESLPEFPLFRSQKQLIDFLQEQGVKVFVITASIKWSVEPGAAALGVPENQVLGVKTKLLSDAQGHLFLSDQADGPITYKNGKVAALLQASQGESPLLACGNTTGDLPLLESARGIRMAVGSQPPGTPLFNSENELRTIAVQQGWYTHDFWTAT